jgi:hypothetical protein
MSYIINDRQTGIDKSFVSNGLSIHSNTVTRADAAMGSMFMGDEKVLIPRQKFMNINIMGHKTRLAHLCFLRLTNTSSRAIPTRLGIAPATPPMHK